MEAENIKTVEKNKLCDSTKMLITLEIIQLGFQIENTVFLFPTFRKRRQETTIIESGVGAKLRKKEGEEKGRKVGGGSPHPHGGNTDFSTHLLPQRNCGMAKSPSWRGRGARKGAKFLISKD